MNTNTVEKVSALQTQADETLNSVLIDILKGAKEVGGELYGASKVAISNSVDFVMEQAPLLVQEFLKWKFLEAVIYCSLALLGIIVTLFILYRIFRWEKKTNGSDGFAPVMCSIVAALIILVGMGPVFVEHFLVATKINIAPRVYLVEYVLAKAKTAKK